VPSQYGRLSILWVTFSLQHPAMRGSPRHYYFVRELAARHSLTLLALTDAPAPPSVSEEMARYVNRLETVDVGGRFEAGDPGRRSLGDRIRKVWRRRAAVTELSRLAESLMARERFDVAILHGKDLLPVVARDPDLPLVVDFCDASAMRFSQQARHGSWRRRPVAAGGFVAYRLLCGRYSFRRWTILHQAAGRVNN
jgi:hypothetical protein